MSLDHIEVIFKLQFLLDDSLHLVAEQLKLVLKLAFSSKSAFCVRLLLNHLQLQVGLALEQIGHVGRRALKLIYPLVKLADLRSL